MIVVLVVLAIGISTPFWALMGLLRWIAESRRSSRPALTGPVPTASEVAVLVAAHNEELLIGATIRTAAALVPMQNIHVVSDGSTDRTAAVARETGANVLELTRNRGKAGALAAGIEHFDLCEHYEVALLLDADTRLTPDYLETGLPMFGDETVAVVAGRAHTVDSPASPTLLGRLLVAYRERLYVIVQTFLKYGQAARPANVVFIVPGFASMYRTRALAHIDVAAPGLVIEDFNMTFEVHAKRLGRIAFHPAAAVAFTQDPDNLHDYVRQVRRWSLGFWQTVRLHRFQARKFWVALTVYLLELVSSSVLMVLLLPLLLLSLGSSIAIIVTNDQSGAAMWMVGLMPPQAVLIGVLVPDFVLTIFTAIVRRRPRYLLYGLAFPLVRIVDAWICLTMFPRALARKSSGAWTSPTRRVQGAQAPRVTASPGRSEERSPVPSSVSLDAEREPLR